MNQDLTSFVQLFGQKKNGLLVINSIEIPRIQRDYAQGRNGKVVELIRTNFLDALCTATLLGEKPISLDFIYGDVQGGTLYPLDGQQRLTTLFLLHWYLAWRACIPIKDEGWTKFTYATRPSARLFCERLVEFQPPTIEVLGKQNLSDCLTDQAWYLHVWRHDPTIQSMLVMLDALHERFCDPLKDCSAAWSRLTNLQSPAVSFHLLPMKANGLTDDLYIKMNSRGKPLTPFENFKAHFEEMLKSVHPKKAIDFAKKIDTSWADILWSYRGNNNLIDDEFMCYFRFITELCAWQSGISFNNKSRIDDLAEHVYGADNIHATEHLEFLFQAFDVWNQTEIKVEFEKLFTTKYDGKFTPLILFNAFGNESSLNSRVDLFEACCQFYGTPAWTLAHTLMLYAVLLNRINNTKDFPQQLRRLRNLIEASGNEIRREKMPELLSDVKRIIIDCNLQSISAFNQAQVLNELSKTGLLTQQPDLQTVLYQLEDHKLLRGCLAAFDLDPSIQASTFTNRAVTFLKLFSNHACWLELTGGLLAIGNYSRTQSHRFSDFGSLKNPEPWRVLLTGSKMPHLISILMNLLDRVTDANNNLEYLQTIQEEFVQHCTNKMEFDWRYYFVKYPSMRKGLSGRYVGIVNEIGGYSVCMLDKIQMNSYYRDPYLEAICDMSRVNESINSLWFYGYETEPRRMVLKKSHIKIQCVAQGWQITEPPIEPNFKAAFDRICLQYGVTQNGLYAVEQKNGVDAKDRVVQGAVFLKDLVTAGL